jgi:hypothetical protein
MKVVKVAVTYAKQPISQDVHLVKVTVTSFIGRKRVEMAEVFLYAYKK